VTAITIQTAARRSDASGVETAAAGGSWPSLLALSAIYAAIAVPIAALKPLWNDEIYSFAVARQPSVAAVWRALGKGADNLPPLDYWLRHGSMALLGTSAFAFRLPSLLAVCGAALVLFRVFARHLGLAGGWAAALLMLIVSGYAQSVEARGYALLLLLFAVALDAWDQLVDGRAPAPRAMTLLAALVAAVYAHYYGALYLLAFLAAAIAAMWIRRGVWLLPVLIVGVAGLACLPLLPLATAASRFSTNFWTPLTLTAALTFYRDLLAPAVSCLVVMGLALVVAPAEGDGARRSRGSLPGATTAVLVATACLPVPLFVMAKMWTGAFHPKFIPAAGAAICLLAIVLASQLATDIRWRRLVFVAVPSLFLAVQAARQVESLFHQSSHGEFAKGLARLQDAERQPIVIADDALFLELMFYDRDSTLTNCYFVYDVLPDHRTNVDKAVAGLATIMPLRAVSFDRWVTEHRSFLYIGDERYPMIRRAAAAGADVSFHHSRDIDVDYWRIDYSR
jgi:mannosyltransferase